VGKKNESFLTEGKNGNGDPVLNQKKGKARKKTQKQKRKK